MKDVPLVLFSYFNPLLQYGLERLAREAAQAGVDGVLVTDLVPEEAEEFSASAQGTGAGHDLSRCARPPRMRVWR